jgi:hypothetical protein
MRCSHTFATAKSASPNATGIAFRLDLQCHHERDLSLLDTEDGLNAAGDDLSAPTSRQELEERGVINCGTAGLHRAV